VSARRPIFNRLVTPLAGGGPLPPDEEIRQFDAYRDEVRAEERAAALGEAADIAEDVQRRLFSDSERGWHRAGGAMAVAHELRRLVDGDRVPVAAEYAELLVAIRDVLELPAAVMSGDAVRRRAEVAEFRAEEVRTALGEALRGDGRAGRAHGGEVLGAHLPPEAAGRRGWRAAVIAREAPIARRVVLGLVGPGAPT